MGDFLSFLISVLGVLIFFSTSGCHGVSKVSCNSAVQTYVCLPANYSSMDLPLKKESNLILIEIHISDILVIDDRDFSITYSLYFNVQWQEPRLKINENFFQQNDFEDGPLSSDSLTPVDLNLIKDLWVPNVFIYNLKTFKVIDVLSRLAGLWVSPNKDVMYSQASQITFICPMIFNYFPLDTQVCKFQVGSYSYNMEKMVFAVKQLGFAHTSRSIVLDYDIEIKPLSEEDKVFVGGSLGNYSLAGFEMVLRRHVSHYIITYYLPSGLFVVVSWISFLVPPDVIPGRMALLVTLFLVLVNIFNNVTTNTPKAEGLTAIEAWMLACILFVFATLAEYAGLLFHKMNLFIGTTEKTKGGSYVLAGPLRNSGTCNSVCLPAENPKIFRTVFDEQDMMGLDDLNNGHKDDQSTGFTHITGSSDLHMRMNNSKPSGLNEKETENEKITKRNKMYAKVDRFFLTLFPVLFLLFNAAYWYTYVKNVKN